MKDSSVPMSEKLPVIKEMSRAIANITEQINKLTASSQVPLVPVEVQEKISEERKKEEIKQIKKERVEMQPKEIPEKVATAKWKMEDIIKVIKLDLSNIVYKRSPKIVMFAGICSKTKLYHNLWSSLEICCPRLISSSLSYYRLL
jgi:hypothetical protein